MSYLSFVCNQGRFLEITIILAVSSYWVWIAACLFMWGLWWTSSECTACPLTAGIGFRNKPQPWTGVSGGQRTNKQLFPVWDWGMFWKGPGSWSILEGFERHPPYVWLVNSTLDCQSITWHLNSDNQSHLFASPMNLTVCFFWSLEGNTPPQVWTVNLLPALW